MPNVLRSTTPTDSHSPHKVFLSKQQTTDLSGKVQDLFLQKDQIERLGIDSLRAQLARTKAVRKKACMDLEELVLICVCYNLVAGPDKIVSLSPLTPS